MARDKPFYAWKHRRHGVNLQFIVSPAGGVLRVSGGLPGHVHDKKAEWTWGVLDDLEKAGVVVRADSGYQGAAHAHLPYKKRKGGKFLDSEKEANRAHARLRAPGEQANARLKSWGILRRARCCPAGIGKLARAVHVLQLQGTA